MNYQVSLLPISWPRSDTPALSDLTPAIHLLPSFQNMGPSPPLSLSQWRWTFKRSPHNVFWGGGTRDTVQLHIHTAILGSLSWSLPSWYLGHTSVVVILSGPPHQPVSKLPEGRDWVRVYPRSAPAQGLPLNCPLVKLLYTTCYGNLDPGGQREIHGNYVSSQCYSMTVVQ